MRKSVLVVVVSALVLSACDDEPEVPTVSEWDLEEATKCIPILAEEVQALEQKGYHIPSYEADFSDVSECRRKAAEAEHEIWHRYYSDLESNLSEAEVILRWDTLTNSQKIAHGSYFSCSVEWAKNHYQEKVRELSNSREYNLGLWDCEIRRSTETRKKELEREAVSHTVETGNRVRIDRYKMRNGRVVTCTTTIHDSSAPTMDCKDY
jgi:hypothetical protein